MKFKLIKTIKTKTLKTEIYQVVDKTYVLVRNYYKGQFTGQYFTSAKRFGMKPSIKMKEVQEA